VELSISRKNREAWGLAMSLHVIYFSPTGTTQKIVHAIAQGLAAEPATECDLTHVAEVSAQHLTDGIAIIGVPVYAGRVPEVCLQRLSGFSAERIPTILVALYGNREYEDALVELRDVVSEAGFQVVAAGAFIGEHSYSTSEQPIAAGRPDQADLQAAEGFGKHVAAKLVGGDFSEPVIDGNRPYRERVPLGGIVPQTDPETCTLCGRCAEVCPTLVVTVGDLVTTLAENCIMCCACVKQCPTGARSMVHPVIEQRRTMLISHCQARKEPSLFR
jgi:ferredoxin